jgi:hypothetical protein
VSDTVGVNDNTAVTAMVITQSAGDDHAN